MATRPKQPPADPDDDGMTLEAHPSGVRVAPAHPAAFPAIEDDDEETPADRVAALLGDIRGNDGAIVKLYRTKATGKQGGGVDWCDEMTPVEFEAQGIVGIRDKWGPGEYEIRLYAPHPDTGRYTMRAKQRVSIAAPAFGTVAAPAGIPSEFGQALKAMQETQARMLEALTQRPPAPDPMAQMGQMFAMMAQMRQAMGDSNSKTPLSDIIAAVRELKGVAGELGGGEPADPMLAAIPSLVDLIGKAVAQPRAPAPVAPVAPLRIPNALSAPQRPPQVPAAPTPRPTAVPIPSRATEPAVGPLGTPLADKPIPGETVVTIPADDAATEPPKGNSEMPNLPEPAADDPNAQFLLMLESIAEQIERGDPPEEIAEYVWEVIPDELLPMIGKPGWVALIEKVVRGVSAPHADAIAKHAQAFEAIGAQVLKIAAEEAEGGGVGDGVEDAAR